LFSREDYSHKVWTSFASRLSAKLCDLVSNIAITKQQETSAGNNSIQDALKQTQVLAYIEKNRIVSSWHQLR